MPDPVTDDDFGFVSDDEFGFEPDPEPPAPDLPPIDDDRAPSSRGSFITTGSRQHILPEVRFSPGRTEVAPGPAVTEALVEEDTPFNRLRQAFTGNRPASFAGVEMPSLASAERASEADTLGGALSALVPTANQENPSEPNVAHMAPLYGATDALTLGFGDELQGLRHGDAAQEQYRQAERLAASQAPGAYAVGQLAGSLPAMAIPGGGSTRLARVGTAAGTGLGLGTLRGAGQSEADTLGGVAQDALTQGALEGGLAGGLAGAGEAVGAGLDAASRGISRRLPALRDRLDDALLESRGIWGRRAREAARDRPGGVSRLTDELDEFGYGRRADRSPRRTDEILEETGPEIGRLVEEMDTASTAGPQAYREGAAPGRIDTNRIMQRLEEMAQHEQRAPIGGRQRADALRSFASDLGEAAPEGMSFGAGHQQRRTIDDMIHRFSPDPNLSTLSGQRQSLRRLFSDELGDAAGQLGRGDEWAQANRAYSLGSFMDEFGRGAERLNTQGGISGAINRASGISRMMQGDLRGGAEALMGPSMQQAARMRMPGMQARVLESMIPRLESMGGRATQWGARLREAQNSGGSNAVGAAHFLMSHSDPEYRAATQQMQEQEDGNE